MLKRVPKAGSKSWAAQDQAQLSLAGEVVELQASAGVVAGDRGDESEVGADQLVAGGPVSAGDSSSELAFAGGGEQGVAGGSWTGGDPLGGGLAHRHRG